MNKVILVGRLTADPELRQTQSGVASCRFTVAVDRRFADKNTGERQADFITCIAWRQTAEFVSRYFNKGKLIAIEGSLRNNNYQDRNHPDVTHYTMDVMVDNVEFVGGKNDGGNGNGGGYQNNNYGAPQNNFQAPPQQAAPQQPAPNNDSMSYGNLSDFEEILSDGDVPF
ncbi:single-stranded DNA-binding protein [Ruminococcus sp. XPD3002]|jgi:single-strand DNA-binding protein|uniref:single-stranded DNA-binding protein n=1 Tax=Ruminococcus sp. XPD3002 TaxID=1452269 RepID=UPI000918F739|nr:single-stranded DNA-binding protein [Ruminococcus sp.]SFX00246.1 single-strand DNA-binding protein [Ruminococcus flavefaciens]HPY85616.1 single-stranded DNA-binding protein [Ruminococcus flavefaciens]HRV00048.1 single-stranded DNA-binding protein [Ruminococcus sp.]